MAREIELWGGEHDGQRVVVDDIVMTRGELIFLSAPTPIAMQDNVDLPMTPIYKEMVYAYLGHRKTSHTTQIPVFEYRGIR